MPTLVIGSSDDRLAPISQSRKIAVPLPTSVGFVELSGGHCSILEQPDEVNHHLRPLVESVAHPAGMRRISS